MIVLLVFAFVSGIVTILSPCILPVLPIVLSGGLGGGRAKPFGVIAGFIVSFSLFTLALTAIVQALGISPDALRWVAVVLIVVFGLIMLIPGFNHWFELMAARLTTLGRPQSAATGPLPSKVAKLSGFWSGLPIGLSLGLVWTPCVGPIMASVIGLALTQKVDGGSILITIAYTLGTAIPMLAVMLGGRSLLNRVPVLRNRATAIQRGFGVVMIIVGIGIGLGWDRTVQGAILSAFPAYGSGLTALEQVTPVQAALKARRSQSIPANATNSEQFTGVPDPVSDDGKLTDYGPAPQFAGTGPWFNLDSTTTNQTNAVNAPVLSLADLRGKVVLVDFWTYSCVNCLRTLPYLRAWYDTYKSKGLVIVGIHTPEFEFEKVSSNLVQAMRDLKVTWPVVQDNQYALWNAYSNKYWPAHYFIDANGRVRYAHFGEGGYDVSEKVIQALLKEAGATVEGLVSQPAPELAALTPETYLGYERGNGLVSAVPPQSDKIIDYRPAKTPGNGEWSLTGKWTITSQFIMPQSAGALSFGFNAKNVFLVIEPQETTGSIAVTMDGGPVTDTPDVKSGLVRPTESRLYQLVKLPKGGVHILNLEVKGKLRLFAFTFG